MKLAITGGTGFVGSRLIDLALQAGHQITALARRPQQPRDGVIWIAGALDDADALDALLDGADAAIHVAGTVNAPDRDGFEAGNIDGTRAMISAAERKAVRRFVHVSSLSAREPQLSNYGWSKGEAEALVEASSLDWAIVRPPAIYGPGDMEMLDLFRFAKRGLALLPPGGRLSVIEVGDLGRLLLALAQTTGRVSIDADDGTPGGWSHSNFAKAIGDAVGRSVLPIALPRALMRVGARIDRVVRGKHAKLTADRVAYFCHPDWVIDPSRQPEPSLWQPEVATPAGLATTASAYRRAGLL